MGYLQIPVSALPNFSKAVISLWFRVPSATFATMAGLSDTPAPGSASDHMTSACYFPALFKVIPLLVFGSIVTDSDGNACQPSFIGIDCIGGSNTIAVNLQSTATISFSSSDGGFDPVTRPACFYMGGAGVTVLADKWHHLLVSFDISGSSSLVARFPGSPPYTVTSASTFSWAFDDVAKMPSSFGSAQPSGGGLGTLNGMASAIAIAPQLFDYDGAQDGDTASCGACVIASAANPIGIPSSAAFASKVQVVEMLELQVYTGVTLDARDTTNRRAFVTSDGRPETDFTIADALLGKTPEIRLHGRTDWKAGTNTGSIASFSRTGTIQDFSPGPSLS